MKYLGSTMAGPIIVHPKYVHTLPLAAPLPRPVTLSFLPLHLITLVATKLEAARELCTFELVCRLAREAVRYDDSLWRELCCKKFHMPRHAEPQRDGLTWRELYRYHHRLFYDILVYRRPDKLVNLGNGIVVINIPVMA